MASRLLEGDTALVTGAAQGIGRACAEAIAAEGARVLTSDIRDADVVCDLSQPEAGTRLAQLAIERLGQVSILVHAATPRRVETQTAMSVAPREWSEMLAVQLQAGFELGQTLGRHMRERGVRGRMIYMTSLHAYTPRNLPHYSASKGALTMVMKEFARSLGRHGIRVNAIAPGAIPGAGFGGAPGLADMVPMKRLGTPADVANMTLAVLSERFGAYVTGTTIVVDGGIALYNWLEAKE
jgi:NAD(P)-dependent dehydrogenase (short-subunit alcohol dehydrogenase family)